MSLTAAWRWWDLALIVLTLLTFTIQTARMWPALERRRRYLCLGLALLLLRDAEGTVESLVQHNPGGPRLAITTLVCLFILYAVCLGTFRDNVRDNGRGDGP